MHADYGVVVARPNGVEKPLIACHRDAIKLRNINFDRWTTTSLTEKALDSANNGDGYKVTTDRVITCSLA